MNKRYAYLVAIMCASLSAKPTSVPGILRLPTATVEELRCMNTIHCLLQQDNRVPRPYTIANYTCHAAYIDFMVHRPNDFTHVQKFRYNKSGGQLTRLLERQELSEQERQEQDQQETDQGPGR